MYKLLLFIVIKAAFNAALFTFKRIYILCIVDIPDNTRCFSKDVKYKI